MRISFSLLVFAVGVTALPLRIDPQHLKELQANPSFEHHRPTAADYVPDYDLTSGMTGPPSNDPQLQARQLEDMVDPAIEFITGVKDAMQDSTITKGAHNALTWVDKKVHALFGEKDHEPSW